MTRRETLLQEREQLIAYMLAKITGNEDWHAVSDAANDLREIDRELQTLARIDGHT